MSAKGQEEDIDAIVAELEGTAVNSKKKNKKARQKAAKEQQQQQEQQQEQQKEQQQEQQAQKAGDAVNGHGENGHEESAAQKAKKKKKNNASKKKGGEPKQQTDPPSVSIDVLFAGQHFPEGQIMEYPDVWKDGRTAKDRFGTEEKRALDRAQLDMYDEVRRAAEAHR